MAKNDKKEFDPAVPLDNPKWELFCQIFAGQGSRTYFNNATSCYLYVFGGQEKIDNIEKKLLLLTTLAKDRSATNKLKAEKHSISKSAQTASSRLLSNVMVKGRCNWLLDNLFPSGELDREMIRVMEQWFDVPSKVAAYREFMKVKGAMTDKVTGNITVTWKDSKKGAPPVEAKKEVKKAVTAGLKWGKTKK